jgi:hypothetical protein
MSRWLDVWWPYLVAGFGMVYAGWRALRKVLRVADVILGYEDMQGHHPGVAERLTSMEARITDLERMMSIHISSAHYIDPEEDNL